MFMSLPGRVAAVLALCTLGLAGSLSAQGRSASADRLLELLNVDETIEIMREEGLAYANTLADDMLPGPAGGSWDRDLLRIYDADMMVETVREGFAHALDGRDDAMDLLEDFFSSALGRKIIVLEVSARRAMIDAAIEDLARQTYRDAGALDGAQADRFALIDRIVTGNDLIDANVAGGLNSSVRFYQGLADGGAIELGEADILAQVWASEGETRADTTEWLYGYMLMAYRPLQDAELGAYAEIMAAPEGRLLNMALFDGFDMMFGDISYALGRALAREMQVEEL